MARTAQSFKRKGLSLKPQPLVLVICEDKKSSRTYLQDATEFYRIKVKVDVTHCGKTDPKGIVDEAMGLAGKYEKIFCVIDRDVHENFDIALAGAKRESSIKVVSSYPCFEYWLLLHFNYNRKPYVAAGKKSAGDLVLEDLKKCPDMAGYEKGGVVGLFNRLLGERYDRAHFNAKKCIDDAAQCGELNPSTEIHNLLDFFLDMSDPENKKA